MRPLPRVVIAPVLVVAALGLGGSCESQQLAAPEPPELRDALVFGWAADLVGRARAEADGEAREAALAAAALRRERAQRYLDGVGALMTTFRAQVPETDPERRYDAAPIAAALAAAREAERQMFAAGVPDDEAFGALRAASETYLALVEVAVQALEAGEPATDTAAFLGRYSDIVEAYFDWVLAAEAVFL